MHNRRLPALAVLVGITLSACGLGDEPGGTASKGSLAEAGSLQGATVNVGSKEFTEQLVLCNLTAQALQSVDRKSVV